TSSSIIGGSAAATNFVIDIEGTTGFGLDFDTTKLANFINDISLPDQGIENERLATNLLLDAAGGIAGSIPFFGGVASTGIAIGQTLSNYGFDLAQVEAQKQAAIDAVNNPDYNTEAWGTITQTSRDMVVIEDFQIGVDNLFLPSLSNVANVGYATKTGTLNGQDGVFIEAQIGNETSNLVFIVNNYEGEKNKVEFGEEITNLLSGTEDTRIVDGEQITEFSGTMIGTFNQTPIQGEPFQSGTNQVLGTFAGDHILGKELVINPIDADSGTFELLGFFGDDFIQGSLFNDVLNGGFNSATPTFANITYEDDGFDILQGGKGDDILFGGTGNDVLDGGGLIYNQNPQIESEEDYVIGVIENDGIDILTGGSGNDTFVFNTLSTGIDTITDFTLLIDKIQINQVEFGATDKSEFSFDQTNGALSFASQQFATLQNFAELENFDVNRDIQFA
ncbi:MAG: calcium-binding protein, partial [Crocosphaera sp.]